MAQLKIHPENLNGEAGEALARLCPFGAIHWEDGSLSIDAGCRMCRLCVKKGPPGAITWEEDEPALPLDLSAWRGVAVFAEQTDGHLHGVALELLGKARELANGEPVLALLVGHNMDACAGELLRFGADTVAVCDGPAFALFDMARYTAAFTDFVRRAQPSVVLVGATVLGRSLAPRVAARLRTGLTADCTALERKPDGALVQIRPAFGGNVMARILTARTRPQMCTVRPKVFPRPQPCPTPMGKIERIVLPHEALASPVEALGREERPRYVDIAEARALVVAGRGVKKREDLALLQALADRLGAQLACTRPLVENGWFDPRRQVGLSGRTVAAELLIAVGVSGSVQFAAGIGSCGCVVAINSDPAAPIFNVAHYAAVGDWYGVVPALMAEFDGGAK